MSTVRKKNTNFNFTNMLSVDKELKVSFGLPFEDKKQNSGKEYEKFIPFDSVVAKVKNPFPLLPVYELRKRSFI